MSSRALAATLPPRIVMVTRGDERHAWRIINAFAERTGLEARRTEHVAEFILRAGHDVQVIATLNEIDREWRSHLHLSQPGGSS